MDRDKMFKAVFDFLTLEPVGYDELSISRNVKSRRTLCRHFFRLAKRLLWRSMPGALRALCPARRGVITGIRPYARYQRVGSVAIALC
eukprot:COSAG02_NODE_1320_length_13269_cov_11.420058_12_plen_88_part_00